MRQDPEVIVIGEIRDYATGVTAATSAQSFKMAATQIDETRRSAS